jgi:hypothetical protein
VPAGAGVCVTIRHLLRQATAALVGLATVGCAETFLGLGDLFTNVGSGFNTVGRCFSPLVPGDLSPAFDLAPPVVWDGDVATVTDAAQPDVQALLTEKLGDYVIPFRYWAVRFYRLGTVLTGEQIEIEPLGDRVSKVYLYDGAQTLIPVGPVRDYDGRRHTPRVSIQRGTTELYLRIDLEFLSDIDEPIATIRRIAAVDAPPIEPQPQTVVLHFGGAEVDIIFRGGGLLPVAVDPIDDPAVRAATVRRFREVYASYALTVLSDDDPPPDEPHSVIYIGPASLNFTYYGIAENSDYRNFYKDDVAIVDANQLGLEVLLLFGPDAYGQALAMVAAHEMGHLLGLDHVANPYALMTGLGCQGSGLDIDALINRSFRRSPVVYTGADLSVWSIGYQDPVPYLFEILGPAP